MTDSSVPDVAELERKAGERQSIAIETTDPSRFAAAKRRLTAAQRRWLADCAFEATPGTFALIADDGGKLVRVLVGVDAGPDGLRFRVMRRLVVAAPSADAHRVPCDADHGADAVVLQLE